MTRYLDLDIETFSSLSIKTTNVYAYTEADDFEILMCSWSLDDGPVEVAIGRDEIEEIPGLWSPKVTKVAHNAGFERICFSAFRGLPVGTYLPPEHWLDTAALAAEYGLPRALDKAAVMLGVTPKDSAGTRLINLFCQYNRGKRILPEDRPEQWAEFVEYCRGDTITLQGVRRMLRDWPSSDERALWLADQRINDRGVPIDLPMAEKAVSAAEDNDKRLRREIIDLSRGTIENPGSTQQLGAWTKSRGVLMENWRAETVADTLLDSDLPDDVREVLFRRQELALVASRKYTAALRGVSRDGRLRGQFVFHGAHTGRWSSKGVQVHNLAKKGFVDEEGEPDLVAQATALFDLMNDFGATPEELKKLVRPLFLGPFAVSDFSAIEARVLAWLAGEDWVTEAFEEGRDLYVETAERMGGGMGRPEGKIAVLAAGYQGSVGSFRNMGYGGRRCPFDTARQLPVKDPRTGREQDPDAKDGRYARDLWKKQARKKAKKAKIDPDVMEWYLRRAGSFGYPAERVMADIDGHLAEKRRDPDHKCDFEIKRIVTAWREQNSRIVEFWYDLQRVFWTGGVAGRITVEVRGNTRNVILPSGRVLKYYHVHMAEVVTVDPETGEKRRRRQIKYRHIQGYFDTTYGGRLTENVTQAVARDLLADAIVRLDAAGYPIVLHVHDEVVIESDGTDLEDIKKIMETGPAWAEGLPLAASATHTERYTK